MDLYQVISEEYQEKSCYGKFKATGVIKKGEGVVIFPFRPLS
jgi:hypothetical protein